MKSEAFTLDLGSSTTLLLFTLTLSLLILDNLSKSLAICSSIFLLSACTGPSHKPATEDYSVLLGVHESGCGDMILRLVQEGREGSNPDTSGVDVMGKEQEILRRGSHYIFSFRGRPDAQFAWNGRAQL